MQKNVLSVMLVAMTVFSGAANAADWYPGQTGQYHKLPDGLDTQKITLRGEANGPCANVVANAMTLYAVDEYGTTEKDPFSVPSLTVFVATDVMFSGFDTDGFIGLVPWLNIAQTNVQYAFPKVSSFATRPLSGKINERFVGQGTFTSGGSFAANSVLCAYPSEYADGLGNTYIPGLNLSSVIVHGTLVDNVRSSVPPYFDW